MPLADGGRNDPDTAWLSQTPVQAQQQTLKRLEASYRRFFEGKGGYPRFRGRGQEAGLRFPQAADCKLDAENQRLKPSKLGWVRMRQSQPVEGEVRNYTLTQERGRWFVSIQVEQPDVVPAAGLVPTLGIDFGVALFAATTGVRGAAGCAEAAAEVPEAGAAWCLAQGERLEEPAQGDRPAGQGPCPDRGAAQRLAAQADDAVGERAPGDRDRGSEGGGDEASAKGTATAPGKRVRQKAGLNRAILDQAWGEARRQLEYKTAARGGAVVAVNPAYTSQRCSACGHTAKENRLTQAHFECEVCGHSENADLNAAKNIRAAGHAVWVERPEACGVEVRRAGPERGRRAAARKQEPARRNATTAAPTAEQTTIELVGGANASEADDEAPAPVASSPAVRLPWPADLPEQMRAVADALSASAQPLDEDALAARFTGRGPWKKRLQQILETLVVLGKAQREPAGRWRGA